MASKCQKIDSTEYHDPEDMINTQISLLATLMKSARHCVIYTGAGISTSAGIPDFRGPKGKWTLQALGEQPIIPTHYKQPTICHMSIKKLLDEKLIKFVVSQNTDGLHIRSGVDFHKIAELHGNGFKELCKECGRVFFRDFRTRACDRKIHDHRTDRKCLCGKFLYDTIINFNEELPRDALRYAEDQSIFCDLAIVLGTSMRVSPACELPLMKRPEGKLVICNLQKTPYDLKADIRLHTTTDNFMRILMKHLDLKIPDFVFEFNFQVNIDKESRLISVRNCSTNLKLLVQSCIVIDSEGKCLQAGPKECFKAKYSSIDNKKGVELKLEFNFLYPLERSLQLFCSSVIYFKLNMTKLAENLSTALEMKIEKI